MYCAPPIVDFPATVYCRPQSNVAVTDTQVSLRSAESGPLIAVNSATPEQRCGPQEMRALARHHCYRRGEQVSVFLCLHPL